MIHIENRKGRVINFDLIVSTEKGAVSPQICVENRLAYVSTRAGTRVIVNVALCLPGLRNKDSMKKTEKELS